MEFQAPICPFCCDDHSSLAPCDLLEVRKVILKQKLKEQIQSLRDGEGFDEKFIFRLIDWL